MAIIHNVFLIVTNPEWIPASSIHNGNKYPIDLETYFRKGKQFPFDLDTNSKKGSINWKLYPNEMETISILKICFQTKWKPLLPFWILLRGIQKNGLFRGRIRCVHSKLTDWDERMTESERFVPEKEETSLIRSVKCQQD